MPVCSVVKLLPLGAVDDLMHYCTRPSASCYSASDRPQHVGVIVLTILQTVYFLLKETSRYLNRISKQFKCMFSGPRNNPCADPKSFVRGGNRKAAKIRNRYNQVPHLTQDTTWESDKKTNITNNSQDVSPFPAGDHKAAMNRRESMTNTRHKQHKWSTK